VSYHGIEEALGTYVVHRPVYPRTYTSARDFVADEARLDDWRPLARWPRAMTTPVLQNGRWQDGVGGIVSDVTGTIGLIKSGAIILGAGIAGYLAGFLYRELRKNPRRRRRNQQKGERVRLSEQYTDMPLHRPFRDRLRERRGVVTRSVPHSEYATVQWSDDPDTISVVRKHMLSRANMRR
jgi:hypothetical protein